VAHHGSRTSSTEEFLNAVQPAFAVISAGFENSYGHPHPTVVQRLREHHAVILRTDLDGLITIRPDGRRSRWRLTAASSSDSFIAPETRGAAPLSFTKNTRNLPGLVLLHSY